MPNRVRKTPPRPKPAALKWTERVGWVPPKYFQRTVIVAFQNWIATSGLPKRDRALVAVAVCQLAPQFNRYFDRARFLEACGLEESDIVNPQQHREGV